MLKLVTFGTMKKLNKEDFQNELENFIFAKKNLVSNLLIGTTNLGLFPKIEISQIDNIIKKQLTQKNGKEIYKAFNRFMVSFGLTFDLLNKEEKNQLLNIEDYSYENLKKIILKIYDEYIENSKKDCPSQIDICFKERCFIAFCHGISEKIITKNNFFELIRIYFILDKGNEVFSDYRDKELFKTIKSQMTDIYPYLKDKYGINKYIDKFFSFFDEENDYNNSFLKNKLDEYYKNKKKEKENNNNNKKDDEYYPLLKNK